MRTTLTLDDDVAERLQAEARRTGKSFETLVNEYLRAGLTQRQKMRAAPDFELEVVDLGGPQPGLEYDNVAELLDSIEGPRQR